jgi:uncharacterized protein (TIGR02996 family)
MPSDDERAFFDRIRDEPDDDGPRLMYADWLDENGQTDRAEFIRLQCALARLPDEDPQSAAVRERERDLGENNKFQWTAGLAPLVEAWVFHRGVIDSVSVDAGKFLRSGEAIFANAPVRKVRLLNVADHLGKLVQSPLLRLVRELDLSLNELGDRGPMLLGKSPHLGRLDTLNLGYTELGNPGLQAIANTPVFGSLRSLQLAGNSKIGGPGILALAESPHLPSLTEIDLTGNNLLDAALRPLFDGPPSARLTRLGLVNNRLGDSGTAALCASTVFARMAERYGMIDLRRVEMSKMGAQSLADSPALEFIESLDLEGNFIGDPGLIALAGSPYWKKLRVLSLRENRIEDTGIYSLSRSPVMETLRVLDLTGNVITQDSADRLHNASVKYDWRGLLQLKVDSQLRTRPFHAPLGGLFRRPPA